MHYFIDSSEYLCEVAAVNTLLFSEIYVLTTNITFTVIILAFNLV